MSKDNEIVDLTTPSRKICGVDVGTMNIVCATKTDDGIETKLIRNMYLPIEKSQAGMADLSQLDYVESEDMIFIIGEDAYQYANIFGTEVKRPMQKGLIAASDIDSLDVLTLIIEQLAGKSPDGYCVYSIPAQSLDKDNDVLYHENVFKRIFTELGFNAKPFNEAMAIIYSECQEDNFSGLAFSYGAGMSNCALSYKSNPVMTFSVARGGDWIDGQVAKQFNTVPNRVTSIKENNTDLSNYRVGKKKERRIREAIVYYYRNLIMYSLEKITHKLENELSDVELPDSLPIVVSGGTSLAKGFMELFKEVIDEFDDFPFEIKEIKHAEDPMTAVAEGLLIKALSDSRED